ncbi:MAG: phosphopyruvate hydratase, partial [Clostridia bacterium]|nr:phosphopyruvate hydratase [Clostridia bacterium]
MHCRYTDTSIVAVSGRQIFDSRGNPTVAASVMLGCGACGSAAVPSGASTGIFEALELRDGGDAYCGKGVLSTVGNIESEIADALCGIDACNQQLIDRTMIALDGTKDKSRLGANAILAVSLAAARAAANAYGIPLWRWLGGVYGSTMPIPMMNILNGGAHAGNNIDIQEFMIMPTGMHSFERAMRMATEVYASLGKLLRADGLSTTVGDEGGFAPDLESDERALGYICDAIEKAGYKPGEDISIALDAAASEWQDGDSYKL